MKAHPKIRGLGRFSGFASHKLGHREAPCGAQRVASTKELVCEDVQRTATSEHNPINILSANLLPVGGGWARPKLCMYIYIHLYVYVYIYIYMCVCVICVYLRPRVGDES